MEEELRNLLNNAYADYSNFKVSCILYTKDGRKFHGVNVENASFGATICAERSAIVSAISNGVKKGEFEKICIMNSSEKIATPCFICRQLFEEFFDPDMEVICFNKSGSSMTYQVKDLCSFPFGEDNLE